MRRAIVTTTIHPPSAALRRFAQMDGWALIVVGDQRTPHDAYAGLGCLYLSPKEQERRFPELSAVLGWNCIQRRNVGFVEAYRSGAEVIASVDDDNLPEAHWGRDVHVGCEVDVDCYAAPEAVFDPLSVTNHAELWHRGFPIEMIPRKNAVRYVGRRRRRVLVQADLWNGDPDVDAVCRIAHRPRVELAVAGFFASEQPSPFNSQNTFLHRDAFPAYAVLPFIGRMDDIWGSYLFQLAHPDTVIYGPPSVTQQRNPHDLVQNLIDETYGYRHTHELVTNPPAHERLLPARTREFLAVYRRCFEP
ncbi:MAG: hypothetical protein U0802_21270 [Candidatus Binatia bacterium]